MTGINVQYCAIYIYRISGCALRRVSIEHTSGYDMVLDGVPGKRGASVLA